ncbi:hypothetical protein BK767_11520 [Bacillus thuringiensis serovar kyushuensis]|uniref:Uncharacterized protein n=1 Tax=Bacillus thuringiensis TaxID=1428 RepID=A0A9X7B242_BACTU|nr:hypothetical protein [Bacillus thuringiensis]MEC2865974.1 hypothetical protein [Bacillus cereus]OTZ67368.1 hypothetical protein BK768_24240 [Bacillus thuringiensis serovar tohokuensis]OTZ73913.1 hypothetical protein BK767_11520 [Bacillus thuringiensis serovar kyushuensis]OUB80591.1 hypothetical protein BK773_28310 [Bacillus thuringiensis serovar indiana]PFT96561.1 hypothetical protein COK81_08200 [Bacillus thuringiensis]
MIIVDGSWTFDTDLMIQYAEKDERTSYERDMLNQFRKYSYWRYCQIRDCVNPRKCKRLKLTDVRERLQEENLIFTTDILKISSEEVFFILDFIETYFELVS